MLKKNKRDLEDKILVFNFLVVSELVPGQQFLIIILARIFHSKI